MTTYKIEPRVKKRWFKENEMYYDLVRHSEEGDWLYNGIDVDWVICSETKVIFSSKNIGDLIIFKNNLER